jgi:hypothetical protein
LVAIAVPAERMGPCGFDVWAEIIRTGGERARIGKPLISSLLAGEAQLARLRPAMDRRMLGAPIARRIVARAAGSADLDGEARARRLVDLILPDTLRFLRVQHGLPLLP